MSKKPATTAADVKVAEIVKADVRQQRELQPIVSGLPSDLRALKHLSRRLAQDTAQIVTDHGRVLIAIKHQCEHGEFMDHVEEIGMSHAWATHLMRFVKACDEVKAISNGKLDFELINKLGVSKATLFVNRLLEAPEEMPGSKKEAREKLDEYAAMTYRELRAALADKDRQITAGKKKLAEGKDQVEKLRDKLDAYAEATPTVISEACTALSRTLADSIEGFSKSVAEPCELPEATILALVSLKAEIRVAAKQLIDLLDERFPEIAEIEEAAHDITADVHNHPSLLKQPPSRRAAAAKRNGS